jgi:Holliday junction DNA helicase RuvA
MMFQLLISVGGIGPKSATAILSNITPSTFALAVITDDVNSLKKLPGIGAKTAQRIILELKDKIKTEDAIGGETDSISDKYSSEAQDAIDALQVLGYNKKVVEKALSQIDLTGMTTEEIIKKGLELL